MAIRDLAAFLLLTFGFVQPAAAQDMADPMALQRCIWQCLSNSPGAESAEYSACVAEHCDEGGAPPQAMAPAADAPRWSQGATADGLGRYAAVVAEQRQNRLYDLHGGRRSWLSISSLQGATRR
ncbi:MAG: hypothetical protein R3D84_17510 [Paracoccaceae bacterium]